MAFPIVTVVLDNFNRTENPLSDGGLWSSPVYNSSTDRLKTNGTVALGTSATLPQDAYWNPTKFGPDVEAYITASVLADIDTHYAQVFARLQNPGSAAACGYAVRLNSNTGTDTVQLYRIDYGTFTTLGSPISQEFSPGNKFSIECLGSNISSWYFNGTTWSKLATVSDTSYQMAGYVGFGTNDATITLDDFTAGSDGQTSKRLTNRGLRPHPFSPGLAR